MCNQTPDNNPPPDKDDTPSLPTSESDLLTVNHSTTASASNDVYLQTFLTVLRNGDIRRKIRDLKDSGSQRSYILGSLAGEINYVQIGKEHLIHSLFGGYNVGYMKHSFYKEHLRWMNRNFVCKFSVLDRTAVASAIPLAIPSVVVQKDLKKLGIHLIEDMTGPVGVQIIADGAGRVWSGNSVVLSTGVVAVETLFECTLMDTEKKPPVACCSITLVTNFTITIVTTGYVTYLWKIEAIGISDPAEKLNITDKSEADIKYLYLTHHPVLKETSCTTNVRPVLDASVKFGRYPSLNDCLEQEGIFTNRFHPEGHDYLKFLWWTTDDEFTTLKHSHIVFGVACSALLLAAVLDYYISICIKGCSPGDVARIEQHKSRLYADKIVTSIVNIGEAKEAQALADKIMAQGGFNFKVREFSGNTSEELTPILGLKLNRKSDTLSLNVDWWEKVLMEK
ncbi:hypothetical protein PR048_002016 [Dryococelus australis]|uniref:Uncharacterized protein n=1 Tax=Dryococelus australis TaxID=614101 RepID=A0ABQ9IJ19_9NEOP|nr:hypothetical protein PR048_002016 [Dryococelus australis]